MVNSKDCFNNLSLKSFLLILILFNFYPIPSYSLIYFEDATFPELVTTSRSLGMGNAFICRVDDSSSTFYNPAGLGSVRVAHFHLNNFHAETNKDLIDLTSGGNISKVGESVSKGLDLEGTRQLLLENRGKLSYARLNASPNVTTKYFSLGYLFSLQRRATIGEESDALYEFAFRRDYGPFWASNISLFGGLFKFGASAVYLTRRELIDERDKDTAIDLNREDYKEGKAWILTGGVRLILPWIALPTFSATAHNFTSSKFSSKFAGAPDKIKNSIDLGFSITPQIFKYVRWHLEVDYKDATNLFPDVSGSRKIMVGSEIDMGRFFFLRFGYGDGFGSAGMGLKSRKIEFDIATYAVDTTANEFRGEEDRRFALTLSTGI